MKIQELFSRQIHRKIEEVIKVDDESTILSEVEEYIPTDHIMEELTAVLENFQETIMNPSETVNIWVSGFFGAGKSSFAKVLGYLISNPEINARRLADHFFKINHAPVVRQLLSTIHSQVRTEVVLLDLASSLDLTAEGEPVVLPVYRALLRSLDYSTDVTLAELEYALEEPGARIPLDQFEQRYESLYKGSWSSKRHTILAKNHASRILHDLDPHTYPMADSWSNAAQAPPINPNWFATRALGMLARRRPGMERLLLIVDEAGQYVARSAERMLGLQGLAEACQKKKGSLWLLATSQEKLTAVVRGLEGRQTELAKAVDRFPIRVDLLPSDIDEVTGRRVLDKTSDGSAAVRKVLNNDRNRLSTSVALQSTRYQSFSEEDFVRLYPLVPYQLQVLIDAVSARRAQGTQFQTMGGSNRTIIKHTQQLITNPAIGLADHQVGELVTLDRSYTLLEEVIPTAWRHEVDQVASAHGDASLHAKIMRVVALCTDVAGMDLTSRNLAVLLHPRTKADPLHGEVRAALTDLLNEDRLAEGEDGYRLQSREQKSWEEERRQIDMGMRHVKLRKELLSERLGAVTVDMGRSFKVELTVEREKLTDGAISLDIREDSKLDGLRVTSREEGNDNRIYWAYKTENDTYMALAEWYRSEEMINRHVHDQGEAGRSLLQAERKRQDSHRRTAGELLARDLTNGTIVFNGTSTEAPGGDLEPVARAVLIKHLDKIYPRLDEFRATVKPNDPVQVLMADTLEGLPACCATDGLSLVHMTKDGPELLTDSGPIKTVVDHIKGRSQYKEDQSGLQLEQHFARPPFGCSTEALRVIVAAAMRAGLIEAVSQTVRIKSHADPRLRQVLEKLPTFRAASFAPAEDDGPDVDARSEVALWLHQLTGEAVGLDIGSLAQHGRAQFSPFQLPCTEARATLRGARLRVPAELDLMDELLTRVMGPEDDVVVKTMHERRADLETCRAAVLGTATVVGSEMGALRAAVEARGNASQLSDPRIEEVAEELGELLDRARYSDDMAKIKSNTTHIESAIDAEESQLREALNRNISKSIEMLRNRYSSVANDAFERAVAPLARLTEGDSIPVLQANIRGVEWFGQKVAAKLDALATTRRVRHVRAAEVWSGAITSEVELDEALERLRVAVLGELNDETAVRFQ